MSNLSETKTATFLMQRLKYSSHIIVDVDEDGERITVRSDDELKAMFQMVGSSITSNFHILWA